MDAETITQLFQIGIAFAAILGGFVYGFKKLIELLKKKKNKKTEDKFTFVNMKVWQLINNLRDTVKASRISLVQFHNGGKFVDGSSMRRMSISHQSCDPKIPSTMQFRQDTLVSRFIEIIEMLQKNNPAISTVCKMTESNTKKFYELHETLGISMLPLYCPNSFVAYGYITIEWCDFKTLDSVDESKAQKEIESVRNQIAFLLSQAKEYR